MSLNKKIPNLLLFFIFLYMNIFFLHGKRYICTQKTASESDLINNFHVVENKIYMAGAAGNGFFSIIENNHNGLLAINAAIVGKEFGIQTLLIDNEDMSFYLRSKISNNRKNDIIFTSGKCNISL